MCFFPLGRSICIGFLLPLQLQRLLNGDRLICCVLIARPLCKSAVFLARLVVRHLMWPTYVVYWSIHQKKSVISFSRQRQWCNINRGFGNHCQQMKEAEGITFWRAGVLWNGSVAWGCYLCASLYGIWAKHFAAVVVTLPPFFRHLSISERYS